MSTTNGVNNGNNKQQLMSVTGILLCAKRREDTKCEKKVVNVVFLHYNKEEEEERQERERKLRTLLRYKKALSKLYKKQMVQNNTHNRVYAALINPANVVSLNTFATHNRPFQDELFAIFRDINMANPDIFPNPEDTLGVLNPFLAVNFPYLSEYQYHPVCQRLSRHDWFPARLSSLVGATYPTALTIMARMTTKRVVMMMTKMVATTTKRGEMATQAEIFLLHVERHT